MTKKSEIIFPITRKQLQKLLDYFYKCEEIAQNEGYNLKWTDTLQNIHWKIITSIEEVEE
jgi:hypothetical protein